MMLGLTKIFKTKSDAPGLFKSCTELPMSNFIRCVNGDLTGLVKTSGFKPNESQLKKTWDDVFVEYLDLTKSITKTHMISLIKQISYIEVERDLMARIISIAVYRPNQDLVDSVSRLGYFLDLNSPEKSVKKMMSQFKTKELKLRQLKDELDALTKKIESKKDESINYDSMFIEFSKFQGYRLDPSTTTVSEFVAISNRYQEQNSKRSRNVSR